MGIGSSLVLLALGAILAFATNVELAGINLDVIGWILMLVGAVSMLITFFYWRPRRRARQAVVEERHTYEDPSI
ncbi:MAG: hypothetical protein GEV11_00205 [Streptosporangiales bacterium]|nr:hypothetical protein [Streptosporangiales bacterium]